MPNMIASRNLRYLVLGQLISAIGDHFYLIAMPWLGLEITGSAFVAGTLLAVASLPRSAFLLLGGAVTDRYSSRSLLILTNSLQAVLMVVLGIITIASGVRLWFLYVLVFLSGFIDAFGLPAFNALLPLTVNEGDMEIGNIYLQGANMVSGVIGPALAGVTISIVSRETGTESTLTGLGVVFLMNAITFIAGISFFKRIRIRSEAQTRSESGDSLIQSIRSVFEYIRTEKQLKNLIGLITVAGLFLTGIIRVGFPLLADRQLAGGVRDFGYMTSVFGGGVLAGMVSVKILPKPPRRISGVLVLSIFAFLPAGMILLGFSPPFLTSLAIILVMGLSFGYVNIYLFSWLHRRTPSHLLGRVIALVLFASIGLSPLSQMLVGYLLDWNIRATMIGVGSLLLVVLIARSANRELWSLQE